MIDVTWYNMLTLGLFACVTLFPRYSFSKIEENITGVDEADEDITIDYHKSWKVTEVAHPKHIERSEHALSNINKIISTLSADSRFLQTWEIKREELIRNMRWQRLVETVEGQ
jgi:hypothetical protein